MDAGIYLILGPMFSGKTTELIRRVMRLECAGKSVLSIKWHEDKRYSQEPEFVTHHGTKAPCEFASRLMDFADKVPLYHGVFIDEGQFFPDLLEFCSFVADFHRKPVHVAALSGTSDQQSWKTILSLFSFTNNLTWLTAVCKKCGLDAPFTRLVSTVREFTPDTKTWTPKETLNLKGVVIRDQTPLMGAQWESLCRVHYNEARAEDAGIPPGEEPRWSHQAVNRLAMM